MGRKRASGIGILRDHARRRDPADLVGGGFGKPQGAIRSRSDHGQDGIGSGNGKERDYARGRDAPDFVRSAMRKPECTVRSRGDSIHAGRAKGLQRSYAEITPDVVMRSDLGVIDQCKEILLRNSRMSLNIGGEP